MKTLLQIYDPTTSDKNTNHAYISDVYEELLKPYRESAKVILEIGAYDGGSLYMWKEYFKQAQVIGIEIAKRVDIKDSRIKQIIANGYDPDTLRSLPSEIDIAIDDGPHSLISQKKFIDIYFNLIKPDGLLIIEDIAEANVNELVNHIPTSHKDRYVLHDLRDQRGGRWDNIILVIRK